MIREMLSKQLSGMFANIDTHPLLASDITHIIKESGLEKQFLSKLRTQLLILNEYKDSAHIRFPDSFEKLRHTKNLYSMKLKNRQYNIRILYTFQKDGTILLYAFYERSGKRSSDYSKPIKIAKERLRDN